MQINDIVDHTIIKAQINKNHDVVVFTTDKGKLYLIWESGCCSSCFIQHVTLSGNWKNKIIKAYNKEWTKQPRDVSEEGLPSVIESMGSVIVTENGSIEFETRLEHTGYYAGYIVVWPEGNKNLEGYLRDTGKLKNLKDF